MPQWQTALGGSEKAASGSRKGKEVIRRGTTYLEQEEEDDDDDEGSNDARQVTQYQVLGLCTTSEEESEADEEDVDVPEDVVEEPAIKLGSHSARKRTTTLSKLAKPRGTKSTQTPVSNKVRRRTRGSALRSSPCTAFRSLISLSRPFTGCCLHCSPATRGSSPALSASTYYSHLVILSASCLARCPCSGRYSLDFLVKCCQRAAPTTGRSSNRPFIDDLFDTDTLGVGHRDHNDRRLRYDGAVHVHGPMA